GDLSTLPLAPALVGVATAVFSSLAHVTIRKTSATEAPEVVVFHFALHASIVGLVWAISHGELQLAHLSAAKLGLIAGMAALGTLGQLWMTRAYGLAPASRIAMVAYGAIPVGLGADLELWGAHTAAESLAGAALLAGAGYLITRKPAAVPAQPGQP